MSTALVISGGGCKGAYAVGVVDVLMRQKGVEINTVCGTSTGGLVSPFVAAYATDKKAIDKARGFYSSVKTKDILEYRSTSKILKAPSIASFRPLYEKCKTVTADIGEAVLSSPTQLFITATRLNDRNPVFFHNGTAPEGTAGLELEPIKDTDMLAVCMLSTASVPAFAPPVDIGPYQYVDGGVRENTPMKVPVAVGFDHVYVILLSPTTAPPQPGPYNSIASVLGRTADSLTTDVSAHNISPVGQGRALNDLFTSASASIAAATSLSEDQVRKMLSDANPDLAKLANCTFTVIGPKTSLLPKGKTSLDFEPDLMQAMMAQGTADAQRVLADLPDVQ